MGILNYEFWTNYELWINVFGWAAAICMILGYMPQAIHTMRTRNTDGISLVSWTFMALGGFFFIIQGLMMGNWPLAVTNFITTTCSVIVFGIKIHNDLKKKK